MKTSAETKTTKVALSNALAVRVAEIADTCHLTQSFVVNLGLSFGINETCVQKCRGGTTTVETEITVDLQRRLTAHGAIRPEQLGPICAAGIEKADQYCVRMNNEKVAVLNHVA